MLRWLAPVVFVACANPPPLTFVQPDATMGDDAAGDDAADDVAQDAGLDVAFEAEADVATCDAMPPPHTDSCCGMTLSCFGCKNGTDCGKCFTVAMCNPNQQICCFKQGAASCKTIGDMCP
jgi:hypothetical protein